MGFLSNGNIKPKELTAEEAKSLSSFLSKIPKTQGIVSTCDLVVKKIYN